MTRLQVGLIGIAMILAGLFGLYNAVIEAPIWDAVFVPTLLLLVGIVLIYEANRYAKR